LPIVEGEREPSAINAKILEKQRKEKERGSSGSTFCRGKNEKKKPAAPLGAIQPMERDKMSRKEAYRGAEGTRPAGYTWKERRGDSYRHTGVYARKGKKAGKILKVMCCVQQR